METNKIKVHLSKETKEISPNDEIFTTSANLLEFNEKLIGLFKPKVFHMFSFYICNIPAKNFHLYFKDDKTLDFIKLESPPNISEYALPIELKLKLDEQVEFDLLEQSKKENNVGNPYEGMFGRWRDDDLCYYGTEYSALGGDKRYNELKKKFGKK